MTFKKWLRVIDPFFLENAAGETITTMGDRYHRMI